MSKTNENEGKPLTRFQQKKLERDARIMERFNELMESPVASKTKAYAYLAEEFDLTNDQIRRILGVKAY